MRPEVSSGDDGMQTGVTQPFMCIRTPLQQQIQPQQPQPQQQPLQLQQQQPRRTISPGWRPPGAFVMMHQGNPNSIATSKLDRVKNGLSTVSNRVSPAFLPPPPPQVGSSLMSPMLPISPATNCLDANTPKIKRPRARKKKDDVLKSTTSDATTASSGSIVVKNRFKHSRPLLATQISPDVKRQKNALEMISTNYNSNSDNLLPHSSAGISVGQRYAAECAPNSVYTGMQGLPLLTTTSSASNTQEAAHSNLAVRSSTFCPSCRSLETCISASDLFQCLKCNHQFSAPASRPKNSETLPFAGSNSKSFYSLAHMPQANMALQSSQAQTVKRPRANSKGNVKKKKQAETIDLISDSDGEKEEDGETLKTEGSSPDDMAPIADSAGSTPAAEASKIMDRMKMPGGSIPENIAKSNLPASVHYRAAAATPPPHPSPSPSPAPMLENMVGEYKFNCNKAMFGELYGETISPTRCAENRVYLSLQCQMYRDYAVIPEKYTLSVGQNDVQQFLVHFGRIPSFVAIETSTRFAEVACKRIGKEVLVPASSDPKKRYIILALVSSFKVDSEAAQELANLVACISPWACINILNLDAARKLISEANLDVNQKELCFGKKVKNETPVETILVYRPGSKSGGIPVTTEDVACLAEGTYLNDIIIDFYLKYLYETILTPEQREKTYIFNSYFYKRLTQKQGTKFSPDQMHGLVKNWTRNVDLFDKDFIVIPVNEHCHWYLVVICFPGAAFLCEEDLSEKEEEEEEDESADFVKETKSDEGSKISEPDVTSTNSDAAGDDPDIKPENSNDDESGKVERPKEENDKPKEENDIPMDSSESPQNNLSFAAETLEDSSNEKAGEEVASSDASLASSEVDKKESSGPVTEKITYKQAYDCGEFTRPCILIFDSLVGSGHSRVFTNLRHYLTQEWALRKPDKPPRLFDKSNMKGCYPKIPRQNNDCDCGVFLLQYVESFFTQPIKCFRIPVHLECWFTLEFISKKRGHISTLITQLASESEEK